MQFQDLLELEFPRKMRLDVHRHVLLVHMRRPHVHKLIRYINDVQRFDLKRLDFEAAAEATGSSSRTVYRTVKRLAEKQILVIEGDKLRINECMAISQLK